MKQFFSYLGASLAAIAALASCNKELEAPVEDLKGGVPFEICASAVDTKTAIDEDFKTTWVVDGTADQINVYHKEASATEYTYDNAFTAQTVDGKFSGTLTSVLEAKKEYQWLAKYPYDSYLTTPAKGYSYIGSRSNETQSQTGLNSTAHLSGDYMPLVGKGASVGTATPTIAMKHASSVLEINVANNTEESLDVTSITFTAPESIIGQFVIDYTGETTTYTEKTYASAVATLSVTDGTIAPGASGKFYIAIKPFTVSSGALKVAVNGYEKDIKINNETIFAAGKIKKINFNYDAANYVTLPWSIDGTGGSLVYSSTPGLFASGLGSDYKDTHKPYLTKFDNDGDYIQIKTDSQIGAVTIGVKMIGGATTSYIDVQGSADGTTFTAVQRLTISGETNSKLSLKTTNPFAENYRYIRLLFTKGSNVGVGPISVTNNAPSLTANNITNVSARGGSALESSYTIENPVDGTKISATCDGAVVTEVEADGGTILYTVSANQTTSPREGTITLTYGNVNKVITVSQLAPVFKVSRTEVELEAAANSSSTITVTSDFDWVSEASNNAGFSYDPKVCEWTDESYASANGKKTVTITATDGNASEKGTKTLGTLTFTNMETSETLVVTVTQKSSYVAPSTGTEVTFTMTTSGDFSTGTTATKDAITIAGGQGSYSSNISVGSTYTKVYAGNTLTISCTAGKIIKKVVFTATTSYIKTWSANDNSDCVVSGSTMTWENASGVESVIFTNTASAQARVKTIVVTYK